MWFLSTLCNHQGLWLLNGQDYSLQLAKLHECKHADLHRDLYCEECLAELNRTGRCVRYTGIRY